MKMMDGILWNAFSHEVHDSLPDIDSDLAWFIRSEVENPVLREVDDLFSDLREQL